jgi:ATP-dependent DNA ligase
VSILSLTVKTNRSLADQNIIRKVTAEHRLHWTDRYSWIVEAAREVWQGRFLLDGEAVILGVDAISERKFKID